jgi:UDP-N-acetylglucosamine diphosphorylase/glucosamine-1-phosphate N-acetyltransferase
MRICIYEDSAVSWLEPIALTRPAFSMWCGARPLFERHRQHFAADEVGFWMRPSLVELWKLEHPAEPVNDPTWLRQGPTVWVNGRWLPSGTVEDKEPHVGVVGHQVAYAVLPSGAEPSSEPVESWLGGYTRRLPVGNAGGVMLNYLWDAVDHNGDALKEDGPSFAISRRLRPIPPEVAVVGPVEQFLIAEEAAVEPFVFVDTRGGPVMIDRGAVVHAFTRLEGPCYVGPESWIVGAKLRAGSSIGPCCRIGGEIEESIVQGYSNKYHEGFLGHSFVGEWINLAAATQTSDLRNDYDVVRVSVNGQRLSTGRTKVGSFIGDHTKTGLAASLNTGSTIGVFANVLPAGTLLPQVIPSFCQVQYGQLHERSDMRKLFAAAARVMQRRGKQLTEVHKDFYHSLFDATTPWRRKTFREGEIRRLRRSV